MWIYTSRFRIELENLQLSSSVVNEENWAVLGNYFSMTLLSKIARPEEEKLFLEFEVEDWKMEEFKRDHESAWYVDLGEYFWREVNFYCAERGHRVKGMKFYEWDPVDQFPGPILKFPRPFVAH